MNVKFKKLRLSDGQYLIRCCIEKVEFWYSWSGQPCEPIIDGC